MSHIARRLFPAVLLILLQSCAQQPSSTPPMRIGVATFSHETCTFCPDPTGIAEWEYYGPPMIGEDVLKAGDYIRVILTPLLHQVTETDIFAPLGIKLDDVDIIVLKSRVHFRRGFVENGFAKSVVWVDAPGLGPADLTRIPYKNIPEGLYPLRIKK